MALQKSIKTDDGIDATEAYWVASPLLFDGVKLYSRFIFTPYYNQQARAEELEPLNTPPLVLEVTGLDFATIASTPLPTPLPEGLTPYMVIAGMAYQLAKTRIGFFSDAEDV